MSKNNLPDDARFDSLKNESARQRWQLFHRAIAHAKQSNSAALDDGDGADESNGRSEPEPRLSIAR